MNLQEKLILLHEANKGRQEAINKMAEGVRHNPEAIIKVSQAEYLQALQTIVDDFNTLLEHASSINAALATIDVSGQPSSATQGILDIMKVEPLAYYVDPDVALDEPCCDDCADTGECCGEDTVDMCQRCGEEPATDNGVFCDMCNFDMDYYGIP